MLQIAFAAAKTGELCPFCGLEINLSLLEKNNVTPYRKFRCPDCGTKMYYTVHEIPTGKNIHFHAVDDIYNSTAQL